jgi:hypothetical protein
MNRFWDSLIKHIVCAVPARIVVEIGSQYGALTQRLLDHYADTCTVVHVVDPAPSYDPTPKFGSYGEQLVFHRDLSLNVLPHLPAADIALIDGDHNWYTVYHELLMLDERARKHDRPMPVVLLHDVDWPYGRRDLYYDPQTVPADQRQPHRQAGVTPGRSKLATDDGLNDHLFNAEHEGGPRNGVRTAMEDFLHNRDAATEVFSLPGLHGVSLLAPTERITRQLRAALEETRVLRDQLGAVERARLDVLLASRAAARETQRLRAELRAQVDRQAVLRAQVDRQAADLERTEHERALAQAELRDAQRRLRASGQLAKTLGLDLKSIARDAKEGADRSLLRHIAATVARRSGPTSAQRLVKRLGKASIAAQEIRKQASPQADGSKPAQPTVPSPIKTLRAGEREELL